MLVAVKASWQSYPKTAVTDAKKYFKMAPETACVCASPANEESYSETHQLTVASYQKPETPRSPNAIPLQLTTLY
jgi:hypothetical protein